MPRHSSHRLDLARRGAEARYRELVAELKMLAQAFPHLRDSFDGDELPVNFILRVGRDKATLGSGETNDLRQGSCRNLRCPEGALEEAEGCAEEQIVFQGLMTFTT